MLLNVHEMVKIVKHNYVLIKILRVSLMEIKGKIIIGVRSLNDLAELTGYDNKK